MNDDLWEKVYIAFSIEKIFMLEFQYIATRGDNEEIIDV